MKKVLLFLVMSILLLTMVNAGHTHSYNFVSDTGYGINFPQFQTLKVNESFTVNNYVINETNGVTINTTTCSVHLHNQVGEELAEINSPLSPNGVEYQAILNNQNFSEKGTYELIILCGDSNQGGIATAHIDVTTYGLDPASDTLTVFIYLLFFLVMISFLVSIILTIAKLAMVEEDVYGVLRSWVVLIGLFIVNMLSKAYLLDYGIENITNNFIAFGGWILVILPLISLFITMTKRGFDKRSVPSIKEITGRRLISYG